MLFEQADKKVPAHRAHRRQPWLNFWRTDAPAAVLSKAATGSLTVPPQMAAAASLAVQEGIRFLRHAQQPHTKRNALQATIAASFMAAACELNIGDIVATRSARWDHEVVPDAPQKLQI